MGKVGGFTSKKYEKAADVFRALALVLFLCSALPHNSSAALPYTPHFYTATIELSRADSSLSGVCEMRAFARETLDSITLYLLGLAIDSVFVDGARKDYVMTDLSIGQFSVLGHVSGGQQFVVKVFYHGKPGNEGPPMPWGGVSNRGGEMFAMGVGFHAKQVGTTRYWLPCYDLPDKKPDSVRFEFITNPIDRVASNGILLQDSVIGSKRHTIWKTNHPIATYLLTFAAAPFTHSTGSAPLPGGRDIPISLYALAKDSARLQVNVARRVIPALHIFDSLFGPYPFEKVGYVVAPIGSMEHQTMITLAAGALDTNSTNSIHELAHMWWGDAVTPISFDHVWLSEGFARYSEALYLEQRYGRKQYVDRQHASVLAALKSGSAFPMYAAATSTNHTNNYPYETIYEKGAAVLGMLRSQLGDSVFFSVLRAYFAEHRYGNSTTYDLNIVDFSQREEVGHFLDRWVYAKGYPIYDIHWYTVPGGKTDFVIEQTQDDSLPKFEMSLPVRMQTSTGEVWDTLKIRTLRTTVVRLNSEATSVVFDPEGLFLMQIARITQDVDTTEHTARWTLQRLHSRWYLTSPRGLTATRAEIYDVAGRLARTQTVRNSSSIELSLWGLRTGVYIARLFNSDGSQDTIKLAE